MDSFRGRRPAVSRKQFVRKQIDGERSKRKNRRIKSETQSDHVPVGLIEGEHLAEFQFVHRPALAQRVAAFCLSLQQPISQGTNQGQYSCSDSNEQRILPARLARGSLRIERSLGPGWRIVRGNGRQ